MLEPLLKLDQVVPLQGISILLIVVKRTTAVAVGRRVCFNPIEDRVGWKVELKC